MIRLCRSLATLALLFALCAAPVAAQRMSEVDPVAPASGTEVVRGGWASGFQGFWSWMQSLFGAEHGSIVP